MNQLHYTCLTLNSTTTYRDNDMRNICTQIIDIQPKASQKCHRQPRMALSFAHQTMSCPISSSIVGRETTTTHQTEMIRQSSINLLESHLVRVCPLRPDFAVRPPLMHGFLSSMLSTLSPGYALPDRQQWHSRERMGSKNTKPSNYTALNSGAL